MKHNKREHPFDYGFRLLQTYRTDRPLFNYMDEIRGIDKLILYILGELQETKDELEVQGTPDYQKASDELNDVFNMLSATILTQYDKRFKPSEHLQGVNGDGKNSDIIDRVKETVQDSKDNPKALIETLRLLWSMVLHTVPFDEQTVFLQFLKTYTKVINNYPSEDYNGIDEETGKRFSEEVQETVFDHRTKALKLVRAHVQRTLKPSDLPPFRPFISDWRNSEESLLQIRNITQVKTEVQNGIVTRENKVALPSPVFTQQINSEKSGILFSATQNRKTT